MAVFTYSRVPAFNPNTTPISVARSATQVRFRIDEVVGQPIDGSVYVTYAWGY